MQQDRSIFREHAVKQYMQTREKGVIPYILSPSIFVGLWMLFSLILLATLLVLRQQVPRFISVSGIVLSQHEANMSASNVMVVLAFLPANNIGKFHVGQQVTVQGGRIGSGFAGTIQYISSSVLDPADIQRRYIHNPHIPLYITQPSFVAEIKPARHFLLTSSYEGSGVTIQVNVGSQSVRSLLPGIGTLFGD